MHGAAQTFVEAGFAGKNFGDSAIEEEADAQFLHIVTFVAAFGYVQRSAAPELLHDLREFRITKNLNGAEALGQNLTVTAVGAKDEVVRVEVVGHADSRSFLTRAEVGRAWVVVGNAVVATRGLNEIQHGLKFANGEHVAIDAQQVVAGKVA